MTTTNPLGRRAFLQRALAGAAAGALAGLGPRLASAGSARVLLLGDSMIAGALGLFLENGLRDEHGYEVRRFGKSSTGLARPDFFDWMKEAERQVEAFPEPDAVIAMFGGNDVQGLHMGRERKGGPVQWVVWQDEGWAAEYARRVTAFADVVAPGGRPLFWIGMPVMRPEKFHARVQRVNTIARAEMAIRPGGEFVDIWRLLADRAGKYSDRLELGEDGDVKRVRVRAGDGIHLSVAGAHVVEEHVRQRVVARLSRDPDALFADADEASGAAVEAALDDGA